MNQKLVCSLLLLWGISSASGQQPQQVLVSGITKASALISWRTTFPTQHKVEYGVTDQLGSQFRPDDSGSTHSLPIVGLQPATKYYFRACSIAGADHCSPISTFVTAPDLGVRLPRAPRTVDVTLPAVNGSQIKVANCDGLQPALTAVARLDGNLTHEVILPAFLSCEGQWTLRKKTGINPAGTGTIIIRSDASDSLAPGTRVEVSDQGKMPTLIANRVQARMLPYEPAECFYSGDLWWNIGERAPALHVCSSQNPKVYSKVPFVGSGRTLPATCTAGSWYYLDEVTFPHDQRAHWCVSDGRWRRVSFIGGGFYSEYPAITAEDGAVGYRLIGIRLQPLPIPSIWVPVLTQTDRTLGGICGCLARTGKTNRKIIFDRMIFDGLGKPNRMANAICSLDGSEVAVINSFFNEINRHVPQNSTRETDQTAIFMTEGPGPIRIENNFFKNNIGLTIFSADDSTGPTTPDDVEIRANVFYEDPKYNALDPMGNGDRYWRRNIIELKRGRRWLIEGNVFDGGWSSTTSGACLSLTPRPGNAPLVNTLQISDIDIKSNTFRNCPDAITISGRNDYYSAQTLITERVAVRNNLIVNTGQTATAMTKGWPGNRVMVGRNIMVLFGGIDVTVTNNTIFNAKSFHDRTDLFFHLFSAIPGTGLELSRNVFYTPGPGCFDCGISSDGMRGTAALNAAWRSWRATQNYMVAGLATNQATYPVGNVVLPTLNVLQIAAPDAGDYSGRPGSAIALAGAGYNREELRRAAGEVTNVVAFQSRPNAITVMYAAPTAAACRIERADNRDMVSPVVIRDTGGPVSRMQVFSLVPRGQLQYIRVRCTQSSSVGVVAMR